MDRGVSEQQRFQATVLEKLESLSNDMNHLNYRRTMIEKSVEALHSGLPNSASAMSRSAGVTEHAQSLAPLMVFNSELNMVFYGLRMPEIEGAYLDSEFRKFLVQVLQTEAEQTSTMPLHVMSLPRMSPAEAHKPICVTFRTLRDKDYIKHKIDKYSNQLEKFGINVQGCGYRDSHFWSRN